MTNNSQKLQQRAAILKILKKYLPEYSTEVISIRQDIEELSELEDKDYTIRVLVDEIVNENETYANACAMFALELSDIETLQKYVSKFIKNKEISDKKKFFIISVLKQKGIKFAEENIESYIDSPEMFAQNGIKDFLKDALKDPEVQIDFLDFYVNIPYDERIYLINSLKNEFDDDDVANTFSLLAHLELENQELKEVIDGLISCDSAYAVDGLNYILENRQLSAKTKSNVKKKAKELELRYKNFKNDGLVKDSKISKCFSSFADGSDSFSLVFSRETKENLINTFIIAINIEKGITSCIGFARINQINFLSIIKRLFCDSMPVEIEPAVLKGLLSHYLNKNKKTNTTIPYELFVWKKLLTDTQDLDVDLSEYMTKSLETISLTEKKVKKFMSSKMLETWYFSHGQNKNFDNIIEEIEKKHITDIEKINEIVSNEIDSVFLKDKSFISTLQDKLLFQAYVAKLAKLDASSACAYSFCFKNDYTKMFITSLIDKSIYYYLSSRLAEKSSQEETNVFKQKIKTNFSTEELENLMQQLVDKWE